MGDIGVARFAAGPKIRAWASEHGVSPWLAARLAKLTDDPAQLLQGLLRPAPAYVRVNPLRATAQEATRRLEAKGFQFAASDLDDWTFRVRQAPMAVGATVEHMLGLTTPQDLASTSAGRALGARPGDVVADLAAAPGVKTLHVAGDLAPGPMSPRQERGAIVAVDPDPTRTRALRFMLERTGVACAVVRRERAQDLPGNAWADKVLLDAPCTGDGTMPKDRARRVARIEEIPQACALQEELLAAADRVLKPGGILVYATCSMAPEEDEVQVQRLLDAGYTLEDTGMDRVAGIPLARGRTDWPGFRLAPEMEKTRRFFPGIHPTLGFFVARLRKPETGRHDQASAPPRDASSQIPSARPARAGNLPHATASNHPPAQRGSDPPTRPGGDAIAEPRALTDGLQPAGIDDETSVLSFFESVAPHAAQAVVGRHAVGVLGRGADRFAVVATPEALGLPHALRAGAEAGGLVLGSLDTAFGLDLQGAVLLLRHTKNQSLRVTDQAAHLVLYGRNVLGPSVVWADPDLDLGDACVIANHRGEALAIGKMVGKPGSRGEVARPIEDLGVYLRGQDENPL